MNNFKQDGDVLDLTAPSGGVVAGSAYLIGTLLVVATVSAAEGETFAAKRSGVFELPKATGATWSEGQALYWDDAEGELTTVAEDNTPVGCAVASALTAATTGIALLTGVPSEPINLET